MTILGCGGTATKYDASKAAAAADTVEMLTLAAIRSCLLSGDVGVGEARYTALHRNPQHCRVLTWFSRQHGSSCSAHGGVVVTAYGIEGAAAWGYVDVVSLSLPTWTVVLTPAAVTAVQLCYARSPDALSRAGR